MSDKRGSGPNYLELIERIANHYREPAKKELLSQPSSIAYRVTGYLASMEALLYRETGDPSCAERAKWCLMIGGAAEFSLHAMALAYAFIRRSRVLSPEDRRAIEEKLIQGATGSAEGRRHARQPRIFNHVTFSMGGSEMVARLFPRRAESRRLKEHAGEIWEEWWRIRENPEVTSLYEPFTQTSLMRVAELRGWEDRYFGDQIVGSTMERYLQHLCPLGPVARYGDGSWADSWGFWIAILEKAGAHYQDGRYRWAARRMFGYARAQQFWENVRRIDGMGPAEPAIVHGHIASVMLEMYGLVLAHMWRDEEVRPKKPTSSSCITYRYLMTPSPPFVTGERREEKLILRGGWDKDDPYMMVALLKKLWHHQYDASAICMYTAGDAILLQDTGYFWKEPRFHHVLALRKEGEDFLAPFPEEWEAEEEYSASVRFLTECARVCFAEIHCPNHQGYPVAYTRTFIFGRKGQVTAVWDVARVFQGQYQMAPLYHTQRMLSRGENYFDTAHESMVGTDGMAWRNTPYRLLISFPLAAGEVGMGSPELREDYWEGYYEPAWIDMYMSSRTQHRCVYQIATAHAGERRSFLSLLIPHAPDVEAASLAREIQVISSDDHSCCVRCGSVTLAFNDGTRLSNDLMTTDAKALYGEELSDGKYIAFQRAGEIALEGKSLLTTEGKAPLSGALTVGSRSVEGELRTKELVIARIAVMFTPTEITVNGEGRTLKYDAATKTCEIEVHGETSFVVV